MAFVDPNDFEMVAMDAAGQMGGAYIESIGKTDIQQWEPEEWKEFISVVCAGFVYSLMDQKENLRLALEKIDNMPLPVGDAIKHPSFNPDKSLTG